MDFQGKMASGSLGGGVSFQGAQTDSPREPIIAAQLSVLMSRAEELAHLVSRLEQRVGMVLAPVPPAPAGNAGNAPTPAVPQMALGLMEINARLSATARHLDSIMDRVEL